MGDDQDNGSSSGSWYGGDDWGGDNSAPAAPDLSNVFSTVGNFFNNLPTDQGDQGSAGGSWGNVYGPTYQQPDQQPAPAPNVFDFSGFGSNQDNSNSWYFPPDQQQDQYSFTGYGSGGGAGGGGGGLPSNVYDMSQQPDNTGIGWQALQTALGGYNQLEQPQSSNVYVAGQQQGYNGSWNQQHPEDDYSYGYDQTTPTTTDPNQLAKDALQSAGFGYNSITNNAAPFYQQLGEAGNAAAQGFMQVTGGLFGMGGDVVSAAADSGIPGISQLGQVVRGGYENALEPLFNFTGSAVGNFVERAGDRLSTIGNDDAYRQKLTDEKTAYLQQAYNSALAAGYNPDQATAYIQDLDQRTNATNMIPEPLVDIGRAAFDNKKYTQDMQIRKAGLVNQAYDQAYQQAIQAGQSPDRATAAAQKAMTDANRIYGNAANLAEAPGVEKFSQDPALLQLGTAFADPVGNIAGEAAFAGKLPKALTETRIVDPETGLVRTAPREDLTGRIANRVEGVTENIAPIPLVKNAVAGLGNLTGVSDLLSRVGEAIESPQQKAANIGREMDRLGPVVEDRMNETGQTPAEVLKEIVSDQNSDFYYTRLGDGVVSDQTATAIRNVLNKSEDEFNNSATGQKINGIEPIQPEDQVKLAGKAYSPTEGAADIFDQLGEGGTYAAGGLEPGKKMLDGKGGYVSDAELAKATAEADRTLNEFFPDHNTNTEVPRQPAPDYMRAVKTPKWTDDTPGSFLEAAKKAAGLDVGSLKLTGTVEKPTIATKKQLENLGPVGAALRGLGGGTLPVMSRLMLNSVSRAVRDPLGNFVKYAAEGGGVRGIKAVNEKYAAIFGEETPGIKHEGMIEGETGKATGAKPGKATASEKAMNVLAWLANTPGEAGSLFLNKASKGAFKDLNDFAEKAESGVKTHFYKREALRSFQTIIDREVKAGNLDPSLKGLIDRSPEEIKSFIAGRTAPGADLGKALTGEYHPTNFSPEVLDYTQSLWQGTPSTFGNIVQDAIASLPDRMEQYNRDLQVQRQKAIGKVKNPKDATLRGNTFDANNRPVTLDQITPDHPVFKAIEKDINDAMDNYYASQVLSERTDPKVVEATRQATRQVLQYAAQDKNLTTLKRAFRQEQARSEGGYSSLYKKDVLQIKAEQDAERARVMAQAQERQQARTNRGKPSTQQSSFFDQVQQANDPTLVANYPLDKLTVDPTRFQYKQNFGKGGTVGSLSGVDKFNPELAGVLQVWKDPADGKTYVVNGHNRFALAQRTGQKTYPAVRFLEADTPQAARAKGALTNIAEGQGTALDAAKYFKDASETPDSLRAKGIKLDGKVAKDGLALSNLTQSVFDRVARGELSEKIGAAIGERVKDPAGQVELTKLLEQEAKRGKTLSMGQVEQLADQVAGAKAQVEQQSTLFGKQELKKYNLAEKARIADDVANQLRSEKREFGTIAKNRSGLERAGNVINQERSAEISQKAAQALDIFDTQKARAGTKISEILTQAAGGEITKKQAYEAIRQELGEIITNPSRAFEDTGKAAEPGQVSMFGDNEVTRTEPKPETEIKQGQELTTEGQQKTAAQQAEEERAAGQQDLFSSQELEQTSQGKVKKLDITPLDPARAQTYYDHIYGKDQPNNIVSPDTLRTLAERFGKADPASRERYFQNMLDTDEHIRRVTGNTFKLDPDTMAPVRVADGKSLAELMGKEAPATIGAKLPDLPKEIPTDTQGAFDAIKQITDGDVKKFSEMNPAERDLMYSEISKALGFPDPTNFHVAQERFDAERGNVELMLDAMKTDMQERYEKATKAGQEAAKGQQLTKEYQEQLSNQIAALRARAKLEAQKQAYERTKSVYFDYSQKNVLDQALGSVIPFNFWARQNFSYVARYMAAHPYQLAAMLQFYKNVANEDQKAGVPSYAKGNLLLWTNPDGSRVLWNFSALNPFNPLAESDTMMQVVTDDYDGYIRNQDPMAVIMGTDIKNKSGKVIGREKGVLPSFIRPNPIIDEITKTGKVNDFLRQMGWVNDGLGSPDPSANRAQKMTLGLIPDRGFWQEIGAQSGLTQMLRKAGLPIADLDLEGPLNALVFGKNAGKPQTAIIDELTSMVSKGEISKDAGLKALAAYKDGNWTPEALAALDRVQGQDAAHKLASLIGFQGIITNTPRQQLASDLYSKYGQATNSPNAKGQSVTGPDGKKQFVEGDVSKFFNSNPAANILFSGNKTSDQINQGMKDDQTRQAITALDKQYYDDKTLKAKDYYAQLNQLQAQNPEYFKANPKAIPSQNKQDYNQQLDEYKAIGGAKYDALNQAYQEAMNKGDKQAANAIYKSDAYQQARAARDQYLKDHPDFANQYAAGLEAKGYSAPKPFTPITASTTASKTGTTSKSSYTSTSSKGSASSDKPSYSSSSKSYSSGGANRNPNYGSNSTYKPAAKGNNGSARYSVPTNYQKGNNNVGKYSGTSYTPKAGSIQGQDAINKAIAQLGYNIPAKQVNPSAKPVDRYGGGGYNSYSRKGASSANSQAIPHYQPRFSGGAGGGASHSSSGHTPYVKPVKQQRLRLTRPIVKSNTYNKFSSLNSL